MCTSELQMLRLLKLQSRVNFNDQFFADSAFASAFAKSHLQSVLCPLAGSVLTLLASLAIKRSYDLSLKSDDSRIKTSSQTWFERFLRFP